jgi:hypothetical protein
LQVTKAIDKDITQEDLVISTCTLTSYHVMAQPDSGLRTDITGQYSNPTYGITSFEISAGLLVGMRIMIDRKPSNIRFVVELQRRTIP